MKATRDVCSSWGVFDDRLPPNMTDVLQVMDLIVNAPLKAGARQEHCDALFNYFQAWKVKRLRAERDKTDLPAFAPPKPTVADCLLTLMKVLNTSLATEKFQASMIKCFQDVGLAPCEGRYKTYTDHKRGSLNPQLWKPEFRMPEGASLADAIQAHDEMRITTRTDALDDLDESSDEDDEDERPLGVIAREMLAEEGDWEDGEMEEGEDGLEE